MYNFCFLEKKYKFDIALIILKKHSSTLIFDGYKPCMWPHENKFENLTSWTHEELDGAKRKEEIQDIRHSHGIGAPQHKGHYYYVRFFTKC